MCMVRKIILAILFQDMECILAKLEPHASSVVHEMEALGLEANVLGHYGVTAYHCWNYIAPQHFDKDATWTVAYQLFKNNCMQDEFNFCFSHWGKLLETRDNCIWQVMLFSVIPWPYILISSRWFKGEHLHGTVAPRASTLHQGRYLSQGLGITIPHRTVEMARKHLQARWHWKPLCEHWNVDW